MRRAAPVSRSCRLSRSVIRVEGRDAPKFLQNLITNDFSRLTQSRSIYTHFLNAQGRLLHDAIIVNRTRSDTTPSFLLDVHNKTGPTLLRHLQIYKMRQDVQVSDASQEYSVYSLLGKTLKTDAIPLSETDYLFPDPRTTALGHRFVASADSKVDLTAIGFTNIEENDYQLWRHLQGVGEGPDELASSNVLPLEANLAYMDGVSFEKGCYLGQELTARTHHTGVIRKRVMPALLFPSSTDPHHASATAEAVQRELSKDEEGASLIPPSLPPALPTLLTSGADLIVSGGTKKVGRLLSHFPASAVALALVRLEHVAEPITVGDVLLKPLVPSWWPRQAPQS